MRCRLAKRALHTLMIAILGVWLFVGCALTPRGASLRRREALYNQRLAQIHVGQTRAALDSLFPLVSPAMSRTTGMLKQPGPRFNPEYLKIDPDFFLLVTFDYRHYRQVLDPAVVAERKARAEAAKAGQFYLHGFSDRIFPRGTKFYRIYPQQNDVVRSIAPRVNRNDADYIYVPR
jgi:hypothetical protein